MGSVGRCPECGKLIAYIFPLHDCTPKKSKGGDIMARPRKDKSEPEQKTKKRKPEDQYFKRTQIEARKKKSAQ